MGTSKCLYSSAPSDACMVAVRELLAFRTEQFYQAFHSTFYPQHAEQGPEAKRCHLYDAVFVQLKSCKESINPVRNVEVQLPRSTPPPCWPLGGPACTGSLAASELGASEHGLGVVIEKCFPNCPCAGVSPPTSAACRMRAGDETASGSAVTLRRRPALGVPTLLWHLGEEIQLGRDSPFLIYLNPPNND